MNKYLIIAFTMVFNMVFSQSSEEIFSLIESKKIDEAESKLTTSLEADPANAEINYLLSKVYYAKYDLMNTGKFLRAAIENDNTNQDYRDEFDNLSPLSQSWASAMKSLQSGDFDGAINKFETIKVEFPDFVAPATYHIGIVYARLNDSSNAIQSYKESVQIDPYYQKAIKTLSNTAKKTYNEGNKSYKRGDYEGAEQFYQEVIELNPNEHRAYYMLANVYTRLGDTEMALDYFNQTVEVNPQYDKGWFSLGLNYQKNGDINEALSSLDKAIEVNPSYAKAIAQKGKIYMQEADFELAENSFNQAIQVDPSYVSAYIDLGQILNAQERWDEAYNSLSTATALDASKNKAWFLLAQSQNAKGSCDEAKESSRVALDLKSDYAPAFFELGLSEVCLGNKTSALAAFENARKNRTWRKNAEYEIDKIKNPEKYQQ